ncbi:MAG: hypothetical protein ACRENP_25345 [Longimicrobiales bacterium]
MSEAGGAPRRSVVEGMRSWSAARWREYGFRLVLELLVVFVGVYGASALAHHQRQRDLENRRQQIRRALIEEIQGIVGQARMGAAAIDKDLAAFDAAIARKQYFPLRAGIGTKTIETHMWTATLQSGALELFDVPTVYRLSRFYGQLNYGVVKLDQMRDLSERMLLPVAGAGPAEFYDLETGMVRPKYQWVISGMREVGLVTRYVAELGDSLISELQHPQALRSAVIPEDVAKAKN